MNRRGFLAGLAAAIVAPAIVRPSVLMPIKRMLLPVGDGVALRCISHPEEWIVPRGQLLYRAAYPELFAVLGRTYGCVGFDVTEDTFRAPDFSNWQGLTGEDSSPGLWLNTRGENAGTVQWRSGDE